jgi:hypothetical protein
VLFERAYASSSWTLPSHTTLLSGRPDLVHGVELDPYRPAAELPSLTEDLHRAGYRTAGFFAGPYLDPRFGHGRGFDRYEARCSSELLQAQEAMVALEREISAAQIDAASETEIALLGQRRHAAMLAMQSLAHRDMSSARVAEGVLEELARHGQTKEPFFVFAHFFDPHYDYAPPAPFDQAFDPDYQGDYNCKAFIDDPAVSTLDPCHPLRRTRQIAQRDLEHVQALYEGELAWTDSQIGRVLDRLEQLGLADNTLVIVTADHGDEFFEHGAIGHRKGLYEEVTAIPLLLRLPGRVPAQRRLTALSALSDVAPTVRELVGLAPAEAPLSRSLVALIDGKDDGADRCAMGRLVRPTEIQVPDADDEPLTCRLSLVLESFHHGDVKLMREVFWTDWPPGFNAMADPEARGLVEAGQGDRLTWIDLARYPEEPEEAYSADFSDPRAAAALERFRALYAELLEERRVEFQGEVSSVLQAQLAALGYAVEEGLAAEQEYTLSVPGQGVLFAEPEG